MNNALNSVLLDKAEVVFAPDIFTTPVTLSHEYCGSVAVAKPFNHARTFCLSKDIEPPEPIYKGKPFDFVDRISNFAPDKFKLEFPGYIPIA